MKILEQHRFEADFARVSAMLVDPDFAHERAAAMGSRVLSVDIDPRPDGHVGVSLRASVPASSIPAEFRSFVGADLAITYTEAWQPATDTDRVGTFAIEIAGTPGHVAGAIGVTAAGESTDFLATGDVVAHVPIVGAMIERAVASAVTRAFAAELAAADQWLAR